MSTSTMLVAWLNRSNAAEGARIPSEAYAKAAAIALDFGDDEAAEDDNNHN